MAYETDAIVQRIAELLSLPYDEALALIQSSKAVFSIPVSDQDISVATSISGTVPVLPAKLSSISGRTIMHGTFSSSPTANTPYNVTGAVPTAGKILYITNFWLECDGNGRIRLGDNITGNAVANTVNSVFASLLAAAPFEMNLRIPLPIATQLVAIADGGATPTRISWLGWEE